ncbi:MAG TPA: glycosyltransferase family 4 protein [Steroidobacteraceae bacterium]|nr:glycosyltransferase family 4 protein [Steroidobacteraceae bacterium]
MTAGRGGAAVSNRLRVLAVSNLFPSPVEPHRATYNRQQFAALARSVDLQVLVPVYWHQWRSRDYPDTEFDGVRATYFPFVYPPRVLPGLHGPAMGFSLLATKRRVARRFDPHVVLASWLHPDAYGAAGLARSLRCPLVVKVHGSDANVLATVPARRRQIESVLKAADAIVAVSEALRSRLLELGAPAATTAVVYNGVDRALFRPGNRAQAKTQLGLDPAHRHVLYVGNLKVSKGCEDLLRAIAAASDRVAEDVRFVFAGSGPDRARILALAEALGVTGRTDFVGTVAHSELPEWYRAADLVCLPSHNEGVPNVLLESMACGVPIVATRVGGIPEVVPECAGLLVQPQAIEELSDALIAALDRPWEPSSITQHAERFDWQRSADALLEVLRRAVGAPHAALVAPADAEIRHDITRHEAASR